MRVTKPRPALPGAFRMSTSGSVPPTACAGAAAKAQAMRIAAVKKKWYGYGGFIIQGLATGQGCINAIDEERARLGGRVGKGLQHR